MHYVVPEVAKISNQVYTKMLRRYVIFDGRHTHAAIRLRFARESGGLACFTAAIQPWAVAPLQAARHSRQPLGAGESVSRGMSASSPQATSICHFIKLKGASCSESLGLPFAGVNEKL